ncbi:MAG: hypothetical protein ACKFI0_00155 [Candidatus Hodgkinia cicadicola]
MLKEGRRQPNYELFPSKKANRHPTKPSVDLNAIAGRRAVDEDDDSDECETGPVYEKVLKLTKVCKVVRGGRRYKYSALVVVGDVCGKVGAASAKAGDAVEAAAKASRRALAAMIRVPLTRKRQLVFDTEGVYNATRVVLRNAREGAGVRASSVVRSILDAAALQVLQLSLLELLLRIML